MEQKTYQVTIGGTVKSYPKGTPFGEIVKEYDRGRDLPTLLVFANGFLRELHKPLLEDCILKPLSFKDSIGYESYRRSMTLLVLKAI